MCATSTVTRSPEPLLGLDEPEPFTIVNGRACSPLVLCCDHASHRVPRSLGRLGLDEALLERHIGWDIGAASVSERLSSSLDAALILSNYSRLVIDINRRLGTYDSIAEVSEHIEVPGNRQVDADEAARRAEACFWPYHRALEQLMQARVQAGLEPVLVAVHSFTPVYEGQSRPWEIGVLWDTDEADARALLAFLAERGVIVGDNEPYDARDAVGYTTAEHAGRHGLRNVLIEIRQDLIATERGAEEWAVRLADAVREVLLRD